MGRRLRKTREDPAIRIALAITTPEQARRGDLRIVDIANHSDADQRHMVRSGERKTIRRQSKVDELRVRGLLDDDEAKACEWYQTTYESEYVARLRICDWEGGSRSTDKAYGHWPAGKYLEPGDSLFEFAREGISPPIRLMFERVVLHGWPVGKLGILLKLAARQVMHRIEGRVNI